jgi:hypothetical protein
MLCSISVGGTLPDTVPVMDKIMSSNHDASVGKSKSQEKPKSQE